jgi:hypothetical protein
MTQEARSSLDRRAPWLLVGVVLWAYHNSFNGPFIFDDPGNIANNPRVNGALPFWHALIQTDRPLVDLTFAINYRLGGLDVRGYHAVNVLIHLLASLTLFGLLRRTCALGGGACRRATPPSVLGRDMMPISRRVTPGNRYRVPGFPPSPAGGRRGASARRHPLPWSISAERGAALLLTFLLMLVLSGLALAASTFSRNSQVTVSSQLLDKQAFYIAEAGWQRARQALAAGTWAAATSPGNIYTESFGTGEYKVTIVDNGSGSYTITSEGYVPNQTTTAAKRKLVESSISVSTSSGTNLSLSATASASSSNGDNLPALAKDELTSTWWEAGDSGSGSWLAMDYTTATTLNQIIVKEKNFIDALTVESSDDASAWSVVSGLSVVESPSKTWTATFTATSHRYFRARFTDVPTSKKASVTEMESYGSSFSLGTGSVTTQW